MEVIPVSPSLASNLDLNNAKRKNRISRRRLLIISLIAAINAVIVSIIAKFLILLIDLVTNILFYGQFSFEAASPWHNSLGIWVFIVPTLGGLIAGFMALYGSSAIRGHGIPEAMEQILTNQSIIKPTITFLKPLSSAIVIGSGGPFGAEGPIIATGGAFGSLIGQLVKISNIERKVLLAAGATAGMSAVFGSPIAAIFLAIELLLFEFSPRSIIPVAVACTVGAAGHYFLFGTKPMFEMANVFVPSNTTLIGYTLIGLLVGITSVAVSKSVYFVESMFEHLPIHWVWWPAIGGLFVGVVGYFTPRTLGVGYENIKDLLFGNLSLHLVLSLCFLKFLSWVIALGSGTSGGTLAPLFTIGGGIGTLFGYGINLIFPEVEISIPMAALVGMAAMFAGASRALLTSIVFALETTGQPNALLPLLGSCIVAYFISFVLMKNTIMTEKIAKRGVKTPVSYEPDILEKIDVSYILESSKKRIDESIKTKLNKTGIENLVSVKPNDSLRLAVEIMATNEVELLPVIDKVMNEVQVIGTISYRDILSVYRDERDDYEKRTSIHLKKKGIVFLHKGKTLFFAVKRIKSASLKIRRSKRNNR
ncbi:MAG: chloride channel protein [Leptonema sp. (in: Bacteria)]|nr:chloride channel protein [Leptonema sp. (in: bacteria)]